MPRRPMPIALLLSLLPAVLCTQSDASLPDPQLLYPRLSADQVAERMAARERTVEPTLASYTVLRHYLLENRRFGKRAEMTVRMTYVRPGEKRFEILSDSGSETVRRRVLRKLLEAETEAAADQTRDQTRITPENYAFGLASFDASGPRPAYVIEVTPKKENKFFIRGRIWVDAEDFAITRIEGSPAKSPSFWTRRIRFVHQYQKIGPFWLAASNYSDTEVLIFGKTELHIRYGDYQLESTGFQPIR